MATSKSKKTTLSTIVEKVEEVIYSVGAGVGLVSEPAKPKSKSERKAARKAVIEQYEQAREDANRILRRRTVK